MRKKRRKRGIMVSMNRIQVYAKAEMMLLHVNANPCYLYNQRERTRAGTEKAPAPDCFDKEPKLKRLQEFQSSYTDLQANFPKNDL